MAVVKLAWRSLANRRSAAILTLGAIALSVMLLIGVERVRVEARNGFANTLSGTDLIVGARTGPVQLLLSSIFRIGDATATVSWDSFQNFASHDAVAWAVPLSLGDSHRGYRVLGTSPEYFERYRYGRGQGLEFDQGKRFEGAFDAVLGAEVARKLGYPLGERVILAHGAGDVSLHEHDEDPFTVVGILSPTGTPVDQTIHVGLQGIDAIHVEWRPAVGALDAEIALPAGGRPGRATRTVTAFLLGLKSKFATFQLQREINTYRGEPLLAIVPGIALSELWTVMGLAERVLSIISAFVVLVGLSGMLVALLTGLNERRHEMAVLRSVGARQRHIFALMVSEAFVLTLGGIALGLVMLYVVMAAARPLVRDQLGIHIALGALSGYEATLLGLVLLAGTLVGCVPAYRACRNSLADGLTLRL